MADNDYGYFGNGAEGYSQYIAATGEDKDEPKGGRGGPQGGKPNAGCLVVIFIMLIVMAISKIID
jgi:hypothetical protein